MGDSFRVSKPRAGQACPETPEMRRRRQRDEQVALWVSVGVCFLSMCVVLYVTWNG